MEIANVIVVDDDSFVRASLVAGLRSYNIGVKAGVVNFSDAQRILESQQIDVVIIDLDLGPGPNGIDVANSLRIKYPNIGLVLLTSFLDHRIADSRNLPKGCRFISKTTLTDFDILVSAILAAKIKPLSPTRSNQESMKLTSVQLEVLKMVAQGYSTSEIAARRSVSIKSVEGIISKIHYALNLEKSKKLNQRVQLAREYFNLTGKKPPSA